MAGWWFPGRQIVVVLPALVLVIAWWLDRWPAVRWPFAALGAVGIVAWIVLAVEAATGRLTLIVDFSDTANPLYRLWRRVLPDYMTVTATTWWWHGVWLVALAGLAALGWRSMSPAGAPRSAAARQS